MRLLQRRANANQPQVRLHLLLVFAVISLILHFVLGAPVGLGIGVGLGVLFAPSRGEDTRRKLVQRLKTSGEDVQRKAPKVVQRVRGGLDNELRLGRDDSTKKTGRGKLPSQPRRASKAPML